MHISIVAAISQNWVIGNKNRLPWSIPGELKHFRDITWGKPIIMGRKTHEAIGRVLPGRENIILTKQHTFQKEGCIVFHDFKSLIDSFSNEKEYMVIGGAEVYQLFLPLASKMYITWIYHNFSGDCFFPSWDTKAWVLQTEQVHEVSPNNPYKFSYQIYKRIVI